MNKLIKKTYFLVTYGFSIIVLTTVVNIYFITGQLKNVCTAYNTLESVKNNSLLNNILE